MVEQRMTIPTQRVLQALLADRLTAEGAEQAQSALARAYPPRRGAAPSRPVLGES